MESEIKYRAFAERLRRAHKMAKLGHWDWGMATGKLTWSDEVFEIVGRDENTFCPTVESFESCIHPDDRLRFVTEREKALSENRTVDIEYRIDLPDGTVRHVRELAEIVRDESGKVVSIARTVQDISRQKQSENDLLESEKRFNLVMEAARDGLFDWNLAANEIYCSPGAWF